MRTTLTLDDDIADRLKQLAHERRLPFRSVVNDLLRRALSGQVREDAPPYRVETFHSELRPGVDPLELNQLNDELESNDPDASS